MHSFSYGPIKNDSRAVSAILQKRLFAERDDEVGAFQSKCLGHLRNERVNVNQLLFIRRDVSASHDVYATTTKIHTRASDVFIAGDGATLEIASIKSAWLSFQIGRASCRERV